MSAGSGLEQRVYLVLRRYVSEILAQSIRRKAQSALGIAEGNLTAQQLPALQQRIESGVRLFVDPTLQQALLTELAALAHAPATAHELERYGISSEPDISRARLRARELAMALGGTTFVAQRAATVASELSRNIIAYASAGVLELQPSSGPPAVLSIRAIDSGPGIADLPTVLDGSYRSRTGLGKGLLGVKRIALRFDVQTGRRGTRVEADIAL